MEDIIAPYGQDGNKCEISGLSFFWDSERCDSMELNTIIRKQIQQNVNFQKEEEGISRKQILYQSTLCTHKNLQKEEVCYDVTKCFIQSRKRNNMSREESEHKIQILEKQRAELLEVNKQWDQQFRLMKKTYENKVAELKVKLSLSQHTFGEEQSFLKKYDRREQENDLDIQQQSQEALNMELQKIKEEQWLLWKQNYVLRKRNEHYECEINRLNKALLEATRKEQAANMHCEDLRTEIQVLVQQLQIYEDDFKQERSDRERINKEKEELQQINQRLRIQLQINNKPDYQWYVPGQLPPDVKQKETGASLKQCHMPK